MHPPKLKLKLKSRAIPLHLLWAFMYCFAVNLIFKTGRTLLSIYSDNIACYRCIDYLQQIICVLNDHGSFPIFVLSKAYVCSHSTVGIAGSNPAACMFDVCCVSSGLCDELRGPTSCVYV